MGVSMPNSEQTNILIELMPVLRQLHSVACILRGNHRRFHEQAYTEGDWLLRPGFSKLSKRVWCFSDRSSWYRVFSSYQLNAHFLYSITRNMLHYNPQNIPSSTLFIFRRTNCIITTSGIVTLCKQPYSMPVESGLQSALNRHTVQLFTVSDDTRGCNNKICPPEDEQGIARNILRIIM